MMVSFGGGRVGTAEYLTGEKDAEGRVREEVEVLVGDPAEVQAVADSPGVRAPEHHRGDRLGTGGQPDGWANPGSAAGVRENRLGRAGAGPVRLERRSAP